MSELAHGVDQIRIIDENQIRELLDEDLRVHEGEVVGKEKTARLLLLLFIEKTKFFKLQNESFNEVLKATQLKLGKKIVEIWILRVLLILSMLTIIEFIGW